MSSQSAMEPRDNRVEVIGAFGSEEELQAAIDELLSSGFDRGFLSLLAGESAIDSKFGHRYERAEAIANDNNAVPIAYVSPETRAGGEAVLFGTLVSVPAAIAGGAVVASGGTAIAAILAAVASAGAGGLIGALLARVIERHHAERIQEQLEHGGIILWVRAFSEEHEARAREILEKNGADDVYSHVLRDPED